MIKIKQLWLTNIIKSTITKSKDSQLTTKDLIYN